MKEAKVCERCGEKLDQETGLCPVCDFETLDRVVRTRNPIVRLMPALYMTLFIVLAIVIVNAWSSGSANYKKFASGVMNAYLSNDTTWLDSNKSSVFEYANKIEADKSLEFISKTKESVAEKINTDIGEKGYDINWTITDMSNLPKQSIDEYNNHNPNSGIKINEIKQLNVKITASTDDKVSEVNIVIRISHENTDWKLLSITER